MCHTRRHSHRCHTPYRRIPECTRTDRYRCRLRWPHRCHRYLRIRWGRTVCHCTGAGSSGTSRFRRNSGLRDRCHRTPRTGSRRTPPTSSRSSRIRTNLRRSTRRNRTRTCRHNHRGCRNCTNHTGPYSPCTDRRRSTHLHHIRRRCPHRGGDRTRSSHTRSCTIRRIGSRCRSSCHHIRRCHRNRRACRSRSNHKAHHNPCTCHCRHNTGRHRRCRRSRHRGWDHSPCTSRTNHTMSRTHRCSTDSHCTPRRCHHTDCHHSFCRSRPTGNWSKSPIRCNSTRPHIHHSYRHTHHHRMRHPSSRACNRPEPAVRKPGKPTEEKPAS